jgi:hypothetical protein
MMFMYWTTEWQYALCVQDANTYYLFCFKNFVRIGN